MWVNIGGINQVKPRNKAEVIFHDNTGRKSVAESTT